MLTLATLVACGRQPTGIQVPASSSDLKRQNFENVTTTFREAGFTRIETEVLDDLITGWLTKDGSVEQVAINGNTSFSSGDRFPADARVVITYHTFPETEPSPDATPSTPAPSEASPIATAQAPDSPTPTPEPETITVDNNPEFAELLQASSSDVPRITVFAEKYAGRLIEFDGNVAYMTNYRTYKTRYDILITDGDYDPDSSKGPDFKFENVNPSYSLHFTNPDHSGTIGIGTNLRIVAEVGSYKDPLFQLKPVATTFR